MCFIRLNITVRHSTWNNSYDSVLIWLDKSGVCITLSSLYLHPLAHNRYQRDSKLPVISTSLMRKKSMCLTTAKLFHAAHSTDYVILRSSRAVCVILWPRNNRPAYSSRRYCSWCPRLRESISSKKLVNYLSAVSLSACALPAHKYGVSTLQILTCLHDMCLNIIESLT